MEKGFNDDELADIMNEIENLEQEFASGDVDFIDSEPNLDEIADSVMELADSEEGYSENSLLAEVASMPVDNIIPKKFSSEQDVDTHHNIQEVSLIDEHRETQNLNKINHNKKHAQTAMNFSVEGNMKLDLSFLVSGQEIKLQISEDSFEIELEGGAKFSLPVHLGSQGSKVA